MNRSFFRKFFIFFLASLMLNPTGLPSGSAKCAAAKDARRAGDVKAAVLKHGARQNAPALLIFRDGERVGGYAQQTQEDQFVSSVAVLTFPCTWRGCEA